MAKQLKDILKGVKASKVVPGSTGSDPGVDYAPKAPNEQEFVKKHETEKHADRVGNGDDVYQATNVKHVLASPTEDKHGHKKPNDKAVYEAAKCNMTEAGTACPVHEMADCSKSKKTLKEIAKNPYAIGMAAAMKQTGDKPPLKKSTVTKAHDIAKSVAKEEVEQLDEVPKDLYDRHPNIFSRVVHKGKYVGTVIKNKDGSAESRRFKNPKPVGEPNTTTQLRMSHKSKEDAVNHLMKKAKEQLGEEVEQVDEVSKDTLQRYMHAAKSERMDPVKGKQRKAGMDLALKKVLGGDSLGRKPKVKAAGLSTREKKDLGESLAVPLIGSADEDESAEMAKTQLRALANKALHLAMQLSDDQVVEPWVQAKIAVAKDQVTAVHDYMLYGNKKEKEEQTAPYDGSVDMSGAPRDTVPSFSADVNTGRVV